VQRHRGGGGEEGEEDAGEEAAGPVPRQGLCDGQLRVVLCKQFAHQAAAAAVRRDVQSGRTHSQRAMHGGRRRVYLSLGRMTRASPMRRPTTGRAVETIHTKNWGKVCKAVAPIVKGKKN